MSLRSSCLDADPKGKVARRCDPSFGGIRRVLSQRCSGVDLSAAFPGCNTDDEAGLAACFEAFVECRVCLALADADNFSAAVCGLLDNFAQDGSCGLVTPTAQCGPGTHWIDGPCDPGLNVLVGTSAVVGIDLDADCTSDLSLSLSGDIVIQRSGPMDQSVNFSGPADCNGGPCGFVDAHLDVIDTQMVGSSLTAPEVTMRVGDAASVSLNPSIGAIVEKADPTLGDSFFEVFFELEVDGIRLYNHAPLRLQADIPSVPPETSYLATNGCLPLFDHPTGGLRVGSLVSVDFVTRRCGGRIAGLDSDNDSDGFTACSDCNDGDPTVFPGAPELCDLIDNDCNGVIDDSCP
jgi:hypothetical protein